MMETVQQTVATRFPRLCGKRVLVAASGGADSTALALVLKELGCDIALAHVHHGIRGKEAAADVRFVRSLAKKLGVPFFLGRFNVPAEAKKTGESLEMAARRVRRGFLRATARQEGFRLIATGHTADDQAETVLMRIARGTSITGLAGIAYSAKRGGLTTVRPLRDVSRDQVIAWLKQHKQSWREDQSNAEDFAMRNRVRHEILPLLEKRLNPSVRQALLRLAEIAASEDEVMAGLAKEADSSEKMPLAIRRRLALKQLQKEGTPPQDIDFAAVEQVFHTMETNLPYHGKRALRARIAVGKSRSGRGPSVARSQTAKKFSIVWNSRVQSPSRKARGEREVYSASHLCGERGRLGDHSGKNGKRPKAVVRIPEAATELHIRMGRGFSRRLDEVCLSASAVAGRDLVFRSWRAGDRMKPLGMTGSKKLSDIFTDLKVPRAERNRRVVIECGGEVAALAGWRVARDFAVAGPRAASIRIQVQAITPRSRSSK